jgi:hypothetical protein
MRVWDEDNVLVMREFEFGEFVLKVSQTGDAWCRAPATRYIQLPVDPPPGASDRVVASAPPQHPQCGLARYPNEPSLLLALANVSIEVCAEVGQTIRSSALCTHVAAASPHEQVFPLCRGPLLPQGRRDVQAARTYLQLVVKAGGHNLGLIERFHIFKTQVMMAAC